MGCEQRRQRNRKERAVARRRRRSRQIAVAAVAWSCWPSGVCRPRRAREGTPPGSPAGQDVLRSKRSLPGRISGPVAGTTARRRLTTPEGTQQPGAASSRSNLEPQRQRCSPWSSMHGQHAVMPMSACCMSKCFWADQHGHPTRETHTSPCGQSARRHHDNLGSGNDYA